MKIRKFEERDLQDLYEVISDPIVMEYIEPPYTMEQTKQFLQKEGLSESPRILAAENDAGEFVGYVIYHDYDEDAVEIGWLLKRACWRKGYAIELTMMLIDKAKQDGRNVVIECAPGHEITRHIAEKYGFKFSGMIDDCHVYRYDHIRIVDEDIRLIPYYPCEEVTLEWYQDPDVCRQVDNIDYVYDRERLNIMYDYLDSNGSLYYIEYRGILVGDVSLRDNCEIAIVICKDYQNRHIGRRCVLDMIKLAREKEMQSVRANIYSFNEQSRRMFMSVGFIQKEEELFEYIISDGAESTTT